MNGTSTFVLNAVKFTGLSVGNAGLKERRETTLSQLKRINNFRLRKIRKRKPFEPRGRPYDFLRNYLNSLGFTVYPTEIICGSKGVPLTQYHPALDVAAYKDGFYYAFEYKSVEEGIHAKVFEQIETYRRSFDYVLVVLNRGFTFTRKPRGPLTPRSKYYQQLMSQGIGLWCICGKEWIQVLEPKLQQPIEENNAYIEEKFKRYVFKELPLQEFEPNQKLITEYLVKHNVS